MYNELMDKGRKVFVCEQCGKESAKWVGHCPACDGWNTYVETLHVVSKRSTRSRPANSPQELCSVSKEERPRISLDIEEFDRVLGGGIVPGSLVLIGGDPGIGKSTLLLQVSANAAKSGKTVLYVTGEESLSQIRLRAGRLGTPGERIFTLAETNLSVILEQLAQSPPDIAIVDSIQTVYMDGIDSSAGSIAQIRECTVRLMQWAKENNVPLLISGHVTKDGFIAGPKALEHIVDAVLYLEGEQFSSYRLLRGVKNRFGSTNEVGVFEMTGKGLIEISNPSEAFLSQRSKETIGSVVVPTLEGTRPLLVEIQALTTNANFGAPRRTTNGIDLNRLLLVAAVLTKRAGLGLGNQDIIVNVAGGLKVGEPAADLGIAIAIASSLRGAPVDRNLAVVGEIGLSGELRAVPQTERRIGEAAKLGFKRFITPESAGLKAHRGMELLQAASLKDALRMAIPKAERTPDVD
jgi:DNA repair protein RadA/Sms